MRSLTIVVFAHLLVAVVHGAAHAGAHVSMSRAADLFVFVVILAGPLIGLAVLRRKPQVGGWIIAVTLGASLIFGLTNHFMIVSPDHVAHVAREWMRLFTTTAVFLAVTEAIGCALAVGVARQRARLA